MMSTLIFKSSDNLQPAAVEEPLRETMHLKVSKPKGGPLLNCFTFIVQARVSSGHASMGMTVSDNGWFSAYLSYCTADS